MALRKILADSHPSLREKTRPVGKIHEGVRRLLDDMVETMREAGGVGLAANQVGVAKRILVAANGEDAVLELINPRCVTREGEELGVEGCLSIPGAYGEVPRYQAIIIEALDREGRPLRIEAEGILARILQHEMDHLEGILFTDRALRMVDPDSLEEAE